MNFTNHNYTWTVEGFRFDETLNKVMLIKKIFPPQEKGLLTGIGGSVHPGELPVEAQQRIFFEHTGCATSPSDWTPFATILGPGGEVNYYYSSGSLHTIDITTAEDLCILYLSDLENTRFFRTIPPLRWLIPMAKDHTVYKNFNSIIQYH